MKDYLKVLRERITAHPPDLGVTDSVLNLLYEAYSECNPMADAQIKAGFHELYQLMNGVPLEKINLFQIIKQGQVLHPLLLLFTNQPPIYSSSSNTSPGLDDPASM